MATDFVNYQRGDVVEYLFSDPLAQADGTLSLNFNPRHLVVNGTSEMFLSTEEASCLDAIYVPSRGRNEYVARLLESLSDLETTVYLLPSSGNDLPHDMPPAGVCLRQLSFQESEFFSVIRELRSQSNPVFGVSDEHWDLPLKRNYALWHAYKNRFRRILLLDDDIRELNADRLRAGTNALSRWGIVGYFVDPFPDTSVIGHVELNVGESVRPFLSGSCLFVQTDRPVGFFPQIYNEDWIFMAPEIAKGHILSLGSIEQAPYDPFCDDSLSVFQEPGEIIAGGLFALLAVSDYDRRLELSSWGEILSLRRSWLRYLTGLVQDQPLRRAVDKALEKCETISAKDCVGFIEDWEYDRLQWNRTLRELM